MEKKTFTTPRIVVVEIKNDIITDSQVGMRSGDTMGMQVQVDDDDNQF